jgi:hypothetical protein
MPKCVNGYTDELMLTGDWQNVNWSTVDGHDEGVIAPGNPGFKFTGPYISTFMAHIKTSNHGVLWTRPVEGKVLDDGTWKPTQELLSQSVALDILGTNGIVDTRGQNLPADNRLRFQIRGPAGLVTGRLHVAVLYWP